jgi:starch phosphorylase
MRRRRNPSGRGDRSMDGAERKLPKPLRRLGPLAYDLRVSGSKTLGEVWRRLDPETWDRTNNPHMVIQHVHQERLDEAAEDAALLKRLDRWFEGHETYLSSAAWFGERYANSALTGVAYFSMEFGLSEALPIYSGGLGILAGDHLKSASDLNVPVIGVGLLYQQGYFRQVLAADGSQLEAFPFNDPGSLPIRPVLDADGRWPRVRLELPGRTLLLRVWEARVGRVNLYLLDSNHPLNSPWDRGITARLYAAGREERLLQELVLGVGGWRLLQRLEKDPQVCHLNEGHAAFAVIARATAFAERHHVPFDVALRATRAGNVFTTHTPVEAAFDRFDPELVLRYAASLINETGLSPATFVGLGRSDPANGDEPFNMAWLAMRGSGHVNGVSQLHAEVSRDLFAPLFPGWPVSQVPVRGITNGVHLPTWHSLEASRVWIDAAKGDRTWLKDPSVAASNLQATTDAELWAYRAEARSTLVQYVRERLERQMHERGYKPSASTVARHVLDPNTLTLGFARRFAAYKRPDLLLSDVDRLKRILLHPERPCQLIIAGKAHPDDQGGKDMVREWARFAFEDDVRAHVVFLEDYDMVLAQHLAGGVDVWLNTPRRPFEACGTSGMKMLVNGGLNCSTLDGWWDEAYEPGVGWAIGGRDDHDSTGDAADAAALYGLLEDEIAPSFYDRDQHGIPRSWVEQIRTSMTRLTVAFSSDRMLQQYVEEAYLPAATEYLARADDNARLASDLEVWASAVNEGWSGVRLARLQVTPAGADWDLQLEVYLGELDRDAVRLEVYAEGVDGPACLIPMQHVDKLEGAINGHLYECLVPADRPAEHYTPRAVPSHDRALIPIEEHQILWWSPSAGRVVRDPANTKELGTRPEAPSE